MWPALAMLTVLTLFLAFAVILIILAPVRPSREKVISMPSLRRNVCARRSRPASARGFFTHAGPREMSSRALSAHNRNRSDALPPHGAVGHDCTHAGGYGICFDDALKGVSAVCCIGASESAGRPKSCFTRRGPEREIGHPWQSTKLNGTHSS